MITLTKLLEGIPCEVHGPLQQNVSDIRYDTRAELSADILFVCIAGFRFDGHNYAGEAYGKGVRMFAAEHPLELPDDATVILTSNTRQFLALASANLFDRPAEKLLTIAITGTKGKTSTSFMLQSILKEAGIPTGVIGSTGMYYLDRYEETGNTTPESYLLHQAYRRMLDAGCKAVIIEAASQGFKLHRTYGISFDIGIFTNISPDHIGPNEHANFAEYLTCKKQLFRQSQQCYINGDDPHLNAIVADVPTTYQLYGLECAAPFYAQNLCFRTENHRLHTSFTAHCENLEFPVELGVPGFFSVYNAMAAIAAAQGLHISVDAIQRGLQKVQVRGRMEIVPIDRPYTVIIDAAHEEFSCHSLFETIRQYHPNRIISVFGCGGNRSKLRRYGMGAEIGKNSDFSIITSDNSRFERTEDIIADILTGMQPTGGAYEIIIDRKQAIQKALRLATKGDCILLIGKGHETYEDVCGKKTPFDEKQIVLDFSEEDTLPGN